MSSFNQTLRLRDRRPNGENNSESNDDTKKPDEVIENKEPTTTEGGDAMDVERPRPTASVTIMPPQPQAQPAAILSPPTGNSLGGASTTTATADEMREARLRALNARTGGLSPASPSTPTPAGPASPSPTEYSGPRTSPLSIGGGSRQDVEEKVLSPQRTTGLSAPGSSTMATTPTSTGISFGGKSPALSSSPFSTSPSQKPMQSFPDWAAQTLQAVLRVSLVSSTAMPRDTIYLENLAQEVQSEGKTLELSQSLVDRILMDILCMEELPTKMSAVRFPIEAYQRLLVEKQKPITKADPQKTQLLEDLGHSLVSYTALAMANPDMFPQLFKMLSDEASLPREFVQLLLAETGERKCLVPTEFLVQLVDTIAQDSGVPALNKIFTPIFDELASAMRATSLTSANFIAPYRALGLLLQHKLLIDTMIKSPNWIPHTKGNGKEMETISLLGPFFRLTAFPDHGPDMFENITTTTMEQNVTSQVRMGLAPALQSINQVLHVLLRASGEAKEAVLNWVAAVIERNKPRLKMQVDRLTVASDGFMLNFNAALLNLCNPITDPSNPKLSGIDVEYLAKGHRVNWDDETRAVSSTEEAKAWATKRRKELSSSKGDAMEVDGQAKKVPAPSFVTEIFYLAYYALHMGTFRILPHHQNLVQRCNELKGLLRRFTEQQRNWGPAEMALLGGQMKETEAQLSKLNGRRLALESQILEPVFVQNTARYLAFASLWLVRTASCAEISNLKLPLKEPVPDHVKALPQFFYEDIADFFSFLANNFNEAHLFSFQELMTCLVTFLSSPAYVKSPFLRSKFVELLVSLTPKRLGKELRFNPFEHPLAYEHLGLSLSKFFAEVEHTGASTQFYDKFNMRFYISTVLRYMWKFPKHRENFLRGWSQDSSFLLFVNMLINDSIYLLDESLTKVTKIRQMVMEMESPDFNTRFSQQERNEKQQEQERLERTIKTYMLLARESVRMLYFMSSGSAGAFLRPELTDRLCAMLNYFLAHLAGPQSIELKVKDPSRYNFDPKWLLKKIAGIYLAFYAHSKDVATAVAREERSYSNDLFQKARGILELHHLLGADQLRIFSRFVTDVQTAALQEKQDEATLGDIPDEFLDPILSTLMKDPVELPASHNVVDRSTIERHLLSDQTDPFNRQKLTVEMLIPRPDIKAKIASFIASKRQK